MVNFKEEYKAKCQKQLKIVILACLKFSYDIEMK